MYCHFIVRPVKRAAHSMFVNEVLSAVSTLLPLDLLRLARTATVMRTSVPVALKSFLMTSTISADRKVFVYEESRKKSLGLLMRFSFLIQAISPLFDFRKENIPDGVSFILQSEESSMRILERPELMLRIFFCVLVKFI
ncbi:hypothetical protein RB195_005668 [Necator americanus]|uniref:F-box domain-containing protein n=1 Tax=Necator americanus TaxID=51031 RepID=A0ABR1BP14_NECAM